MDNKIPQQCSVLNILYNAGYGGGFGHERFEITVNFAKTLVAFCKNLNKKFETWLDSPTVKSNLKTRPYSNGSDWGYSKRKSAEFYKPPMIKRKELFANLDSDSAQFIKDLYVGLIIRLYIKYNI